MKPVKFKEHNIVFAEDQPEYLPLPAFKDSGPQGQVVSCWKLNWKERIKILFSGKLWACSMTFHSPLQPLFFTPFKDEVLITKDQ